MPNLHFTWHLDCKQCTFHRLATDPELLIAHAIDHALKTRHTHIVWYPADDLEQALPVPNLDMFLN